jgi:glycerol-3-phosphate cytidylyltransferase
MGITFLTFDLFHAGRFKVLEEVKHHCDYLILGLQLDPAIKCPKKKVLLWSFIELYMQL